MNSQSYTAHREVTYRDLTECDDEIMHCMIISHNHLDMSGLVLVVLVAYAG